MEVVAWEERVADPPAPEVAGRGRGWAGGLNKLPFTENAEHCRLATVDGDHQGLIRWHKVERFSQKDAVSTHRKRRRWLCKQLGWVPRCRQRSNFLNLTAEDMQGIKRRNEILAVKKEAHFRNMFSSYIMGIVGDEGIMKEMNELVAKHDHMLANKRLSLHQCWHEHVYRKINEQVENKLKLLSVDQIKDKLRYFHYQYINASNQRLLFLDAVDNTFYDPFESLKYLVKYNTNFCDPLKHDIEKMRKIILTWLSGTLSKLLSPRCDDAEGFKEFLLQGKHIVPNQGKQWSFRERHEGKAKVYGLPCMMQPKLQLSHL